MKAEEPKREEWCFAAVKTGAWLRLVEGLLLRPPAGGGVRVTG